MEAVVLQFDAPDVQTVVETVEKHVRLAVVVDEQCIVDGLLAFEERLLLRLDERAERMVRHGDADMFVRRIVHVEFAFHFIDFRRPEPSFTV